VNISLSVHADSLYCIWSAPQNLENQGSSSRYVTPSTVSYPHFERMVTGLKLGPGCACCVMAYAAC
jgi:hypothetical protein